MIIYPLYRTNLLIKKKLEGIFTQSNKDVKVNRVTTKEYGISISKRPFNSRLDKSKLISNGFEPLPDWKDALRRYLICLNWFL